MASRAFAVSPSSIEGHGINNNTWSIFSPSTVAVILLSVLVAQNAWESAPRWLKDALTLKRKGDGEKSSDSDGDKQ